MSDLPPEAARELGRLELIHALFTPPSLEVLQARLQPIIEGIVAAPGALSEFREALRVARGRPAGPGALAEDEDGRQLLLVLDGRGPHLVITQRAERRGDADAS